MRHLLGIKRESLALFLLLAMLVGCGASAQESAAASPGHTNYTIYFRDNSDLTFPPSDPSILFDDNADKTQLGDAEREILEAAGIIPKISGYETFAGDVFRVEDDIYVILFYLIHLPNDEKDLMREIKVSIHPNGRSETEEALFRDGISPMEVSKVTVTDVNGITVYGDGTPESQQGRMLGFLGQDGAWYQIYALRSTPVQDMGTVLDFYLDNSLDIEALP